MNENLIKSYIAGMLDSSGKITVVKVPTSPNSVYIKVVLKADKEEPLQQIKEIYGGSIRKQKRIYHLVLTHRKAKKLLEDVKEFLISKREETDIVLELYRDRFTRKYEAERKKQIVKKLLEIKKEKPKLIKEGKSSVYKWVKE